MNDKKFAETLKAAKRVMFIHVYRAGTDEIVGSVFGKNPVADFFEKYHGAKIADLGIYRYDTQGHKQVAIYIA